MGAELRRLGWSIPVGPFLVNFTRPSTRKRLYTFVARQFGALEKPARRVQFLAQIESRLFDFLNGPRVFEFEGDLRSGDAQTLIAWRQVVPAAEAKSTSGEARLWELGLLFGPVNMIRMQKVE